MNQYTVWVTYLSGNIEVTETVLVEATDEQTACQKAETTLCLSREGKLGFEHRYRATRVRME